MESSKKEQQKIEMCREMNDEFDAELCAGGGTSDVRALINEPGSTNDA